MRCYTPNFSDDKFRPLNDIGGAGQMLLATSSTRMLNRRFLSQAADAVLCPQLLRR